MVINVIISEDQLEILLYCQIVCVKQFSQKCLIKHYEYADLYKNEYTQTKEEF